MSYHPREGQSKDVKAMVDLILSTIGVPQARAEYNSVMNELLHRMGLGTRYHVLEEVETKEIHGLVGITLRSKFAHMIGPLLSSKVDKQDILTFAKYIEFVVLNSGVKKIVTQLPAKSPIVKYLQERGYRIARIVVEHWEGEPRFMETPQIPEIEISAFKEEDIKPVYNLLVPHFDAEAGLVITYEDFTYLAQDAIRKEKEGWVVAKDEENKIVGFGASFSTNPFRQQAKTAVIYGPIGESPEIEAFILGELIAYWKLKGNRRIVNVRKETSIEEEIFLQSIGLKQVLQVVNLEKHL